MDSAALYHILTRVVGRRNLGGGTALDGYGGGGKHIFKVPLEVELCVYSTLKK